MNRTGGPYLADPGDDFGQYVIMFGSDDEGRQPPDKIIDFNRPPSGQPGLWCKWEPTDDGTAIVWDGGEKFYDSPEWMQYLIDHFLKPGAQAQQVAPEYRDDRFDHFTWDHVLNGQIRAEGEEPGDHWMLIVKDNDVSVRQGKVVYE